jgi:hypothetical protein
VLAAQPRDVRAAHRHQRPETGEDALDVVNSDRHGQHVVDLGEQILDVGTACRGSGGVIVPLGVVSPISQ